MRPLWSAVYVETVEETDDQNQDCKYLGLPRMLGAGSASVAIGYVSSVRNPRPDLSYYSSGLNGLQVIPGNGTEQLAGGSPDGGSRVFQWGWNPIGGARANDNGLTPNDLIATASLNSVTVQV
jgi:hypothetical protein